VLDRDHPPAAPAVYRGRGEIDSYYRDVCGRNMEHQVTDLIITTDRIAYTQHCRYPGGEQVLCVTVAALTDGLISTQPAVQVWDS
jgi:hypothetical protein